MVMVINVKSRETISISVIGKNWYASFATILSAKNSHFSFPNATKLLY